MVTPTDARRGHRTFTPAKAQLTLVEHALCPLDTSVSLQPNLIHKSTFSYSDRHRNRRTGHARIGATHGMSPHDELYLWGLLAIAFSQPEPTADFYATPYYCLRHIGKITAAKRGERDFLLFRNAIQRLAGIQYENAAFYDPIRGEHRSVSFGLLNYSLPLHSDSSRAWRFAWDPIFFELAQATGGALSFDLSIYRDLDAATRRLYLFLKKLFHRNETTGRIDLHHLAVDVLGFSPSMEMSHLKRKVTRCVENLLRIQFLCLPSNVETPKSLFVKKRKGVYSIRLYRGPAFNNVTHTTTMDDSPLIDPLRSIGFDAPAISRIINRFPSRVIEQWADITLAAIERRGPTFFTNSPQAYFLDNLKAAAEQRRTPPDWWRELRKREQELERKQDREKATVLQTADTDTSFEEYLKTAAREVFDDIMRKLCSDLRQAGQSEPQAKANADYLTRQHLWNRYCKEHPNADRSHAFQPRASLS